MTKTWANQITTANAGWRWQFRCRGSRHRPGVAEFKRSAAYALTLRSVHALGTPGTSRGGFPHRSSPRPTQTGRSLQAPPRRHRRTLSSSHQSQIHQTPTRQNNPAAPNRSGPWKFQSQLAYYVLGCSRSGR
jgi:hypothetical protein